MGSGCLDLRFLDFYSRWTWFFSFTPWSLYRRRKRHQHPLHRTPNGLERESEQYGEVNSLMLPGLELRSHVRQACSLSLYRLGYSGSWTDLSISAVAVSQCMAERWGSGVIVATYWLAAKEPASAKSRKVLIYVPSLIYLTSHHSVCSCAFFFYHNYKFQISTCNQRLYNIIDVLLWQKAWSSRLRTVVSCNRF